ncbi:MAG: winged helix-turn-helix domain-containing protein, partial [Woeseiaceae bacterium]
MIYQIGDFELDLVRVELRKAGVPLEVEPQVFSLLAYLIENRERLVSKDEIFEKVWDGRSVSDSALTSRIKMARKLLGDDGKSQKIIKTAYGKGYRFVARVQVQRDLATISFVGGDAAEHAEQITQAPGVDDARPSIAVLPFRVIGEARPFSSIADGLPHELITELARLRWLFVIARGSSFRLGASHLQANQIGRLLGVRYVLSGSVEVIRQRLVVTTELVDSRNDEVVWGERYSGFVDDVHALREDIRSRVLTALEVRI